MYIQNIDSRDAMEKQYPELYALRLIGGDKGLLIIRNLMGGGLGFNEIMRRTSSRSAKTTSSTLKRLIRCGVVHKEEVSRLPFVSIYSLTGKGRELSRIVYRMHLAGRRLRAL